MSICLTNTISRRKTYQDNKTAYKALLHILELTIKAAIIHTSGTGKSNMVYKLLWDFPDKFVLRFFLTYERLLM